MRRFADVCQWPFSAVLKVALLLLWLMAPAWLRSQTISGTVQDPSGAVIAGARIEISGADLAQPVVLSSDGAGNFASPDLKPGTYSVRVVRDGFEALVKTVDLQASVQLQLTLTIAKQQSQHFRCRKESGVRQFRSHLPATPRSRSGPNLSLRQFHPAIGRRNLPVSERHADVSEPGEWSCNRRDLHRRRTFQSKACDSSRRSRTEPPHRSETEVNEDFTEVVFRFTGDARLKFLRGLGDRTEPASEAAAVLRPLAGEDAAAPRTASGFHRVSVAGRNHGQRGRRPSGCRLQSRASGILQRLSSRQEAQGSPFFRAALEWERCLSSIRRKKSRSSTTIPKGWTTASGIWRT